MTNPDRPWNCPRDTSCPTKRAHDTYSAYRYGCRSGAAQKDKKRYDKSRHAGIQRPRTVDSTGVARRLQALTAIGWPATRLAAELGWDPAHIARLRRPVHAYCSHLTARRVTTVYNRLQGTPGGSNLSVIRARKAGWAPPLAWDDHTIDDPTATPWTDDLEEQRLDGGIVEAALALGLRWKQMSTADREELVAGLRGRRTEAEVADLVKTTQQTIRKTWDRIQAKQRRDAALARQALEAKRDELEDAA